MQPRIELFKQFVSKDIKGKLRYIKLYWLNYGEYMEIVRKSGVVGSAKETPQPTLTITEGKQGRDLNQQADLEVKSIINKYESKGYKDLASVTNKNIEDMTVELFDEYFKGIKTDKYGNVKPMLAKSTDDLKKTSLERHWFASVKLDGKTSAVFKFR